MTAVKDLFADAVTPTEIATRFEAFKSSLDKSAQDRQARQAAGATWIPPHMNDGNGEWIVPGATPAGDALALLSKSVSPEVLASLRTELDKAGALGADVGKDISLTSPLSTGLVPFDLEAPAKLVFPVLTPLRNMIPRVKGQGVTRRYKRITGISGSGTGGVANLSPFINDSSTISVGSLTLRRGPKISYAADDRTATYKQMGASDVVTWSAEFAGQGFTDVRQLSQTALLYASMLADERALLAARGTDAGVYVGTLAAPSVANVTLTARVAGAGETGNSANIANLFVTLSAEGMFGESARSTEINSTILSATTGKVVDVTMTGAFVAGATGYRVYAGTATGIANQFLVGRTGAWGGVTGVGTAAFVINFTGAGTGGAPNAGTNAVAADTASSADAYDGILTTQLDPTQGGIIYSVGAKLSTASPGVEFQNAFQALYNGVAPGGGYTGVNAAVNSQGVKANPDRIWASGQDRKQLSNSYLAGSSGNPTFFMSVDVPDAAGMRMGQVVTAILNEVTGKEVSVSVHPWLPQGNALVLSDNLPIPDSQVPACFSYALPQDYMGINWPVIQHTYDVSSYWFGALINYAPSFSGVVANILAG